MSSSKRAPLAVSAVISAALMLGAVVSAGPVSAAPLTTPPPTTSDASAAASASVSLAVPEPFSHTVRVSVDATSDDDPLLLPTSATSVSFVLPDPSLEVTTVAYRVFGANFESTGTANVDPATRTVLVPLPTDFFTITPDHSPLSGGIIIGPGGPVQDPAPYYGVTLESTDDDVGPVPPTSAQIASPVGNRFTAGLILKGVGDSTETGPTIPLTWNPDDPWMLFEPKQFQHFEYSWIPEVQSVRAGDTVTLTASSGYFQRGLGMPFSITTRVAYSGELEGFNVLPVPNVVSADGSAMTLTIPPEIDGPVFAGEPRIEVVMESGFEGQERVDVAVPIAILPAAPDAAPTILGVTPAPSARFVNRNANPTATFSEGVIGVSAASVRLTKVSNGYNLPATVAFDPSSNTVTLDPIATLAPFSRYKVTVDGGDTAVRDPAGNPVASRTWYFVTGVSR